MRAVVVVCVLAPLLAGCGIPDLLAHTVKVVERSQRTSESSPAAAGTPPPSGAVSPRDHAAEAPPPPAAAPLYAPSPRGGSGGVTVEELPPR